MAPPKPGSGMELYVSTVPLTSERISLAVPSLTMTSSTPDEIGLSFLDDGHVIGDGLDFSPSLESTSVDPAVTVASNALEWNQCRVEVLPAVDTYLVRG